MTQKASQPTAGSTPQEADRIRDIIFGPQIREYEQRFQSLQRDVERLQQELDRMHEELTEQDAEQNKRLQAVRRDLRQGDDDLRTELRQTAQALSFEKVVRFSLGELFVNLGTHLKTGGSLADLLTGLVPSE